MIESVRDVKRCHFGKTGQEVSSGQKMTEIRRACLAVAVLAGSASLYQISLVRIFSFVTWHHFAFMVLSIALLGLGLSGVLLCSFPKLGEPAPEKAGLYSFWLGPVVIASCWLLGRLPLEATKLQEEPINLLVLLLYYLLPTVGFCLIGLGLVTLLRGYSGQAETVYASDLVGASVGCLLAALGAYWLGIPGLLLLTAGLGAGASFILNRSRSALVSLVLWLVLIPVGNHFLTFRPAPAKALGILESQGGGSDQRLYQGWSSTSRVDLVAQSPPVAWIENPNSEDRPLPQPLLVIDGDAATPVIKEGPEQRFLDWTLSSVALQALAPKKVLVIGAGGGVDIATALHHGATEVDAIEVNPLVVELMTGEFAHLNGDLFLRDEVELRLEDGRSFVSRSEQRYDAVQLSLIDTWAASSAGAYGLSEENLYTVEAFEDYLNRLSQNGFLTVSRWFSNPPKASLKLCTTAAEALKRIDPSLEPKDHILVLATPFNPLVNVVVKRAPFTSEELESAFRLASKRGMSFLYAPNLDLENPFTTYLRSSEPEQFFGQYPYDVRPATDDRPFFFQFGRWRDFSLSAGFGDIFLTRMLLLAILLQATLLAMVLMAIPWWTTEKTGDRAPVVLYFSLLGAGFMLFEVALIQHFTRYFGSPVYSLSFVLATLLLSAGAGSFLAARLPGDRPPPVYLLIVGLAILYAFGLPSLLKATISLSLLGRMVVGFLVVAPLGVCLGVPFPTAIRRFESRPELVGWAWAANGFASVLGPVVAIMLAIDLGFTWVLLVGAACYLSALLAAKRLWSVA